MEVIAKTYAESLFDLALEENKVDSFTKDMGAIYTVFNENPSFIEFFSHIMVKEEDKNQLLEKSFQEVDAYVLNFLKLLVRKKRIRYIVSISSAFQELVDDYLGIKKGIIFSSFDLSKEQVVDIEKALSIKEKKTVSLTTQKDESLIGGIKVQIGNRIYDASIKNKLESMKKELIRK
ncbi:F0F1 ATP synthase subunit delta [Tannockella kyphosi]|uniref:F0F1 ATP synthase subunit delta n=1 Tax=Tannockella kyphosi TaxID=2899121 RepID=UPI002010F6B7|nr:F0F1 ATP synthase subunit delta [Tannockella kyphosi]